MQPHPPHIEWLAPWEPVRGGHSDDGSVRELRREISDQHALHGVPLRTIARRQDCDDVLFELLDGSGRFAVVHLTYATQREQDPRWPETRLFKDWLHFERDGMRADHAEWG